MASTDDPLDDPAGLWPGPPPAAKKKPAKRRWVWSAMAPRERQERYRELAPWVEWLKTEHELHNDIVACWYQHKSVRELLTALYVSWVRVYVDGPSQGRDTVEVEWILTLRSVTPHLRVPACATRGHIPPPPPLPQPPDAQKTFETWLKTATDATEPARHPAEAALRRLEEPPL